MAEVRQGHSLVIEEGRLWSNEIVNRDCRVDKALQEDWRGVCTCIYDRRNRLPRTEEAHNMYHLLF